MGNLENLTLMRMLAQVTSDLGVSEHTYVVGGAVRDFALERPIKDIDVVTDTVSGGMSSEQLAKALASLSPGSGLVTNNYGVAILTLGRRDWEGVSLKGMVVEIANARKESYGGHGGKGYKPHMVEPATILEDVVRREFRFNTLLLRMSDLREGPQRAKVLDLTGEGLGDLARGEMICPANPNKVFTDDPTRMLRAIKFGMRFGFTLGDQECRAIRAHAHALAKVPQNAVATILIENIFKVDTSRGLDWLYQLGLVPVIQDMLEDEPNFKTTLTNWARTNVEDMLCLAIYGGFQVTGGLRHLLGGDPVGKSSEGLYRLEKALAIFEGDAEKALALVEAIKQPGRVMDTRALAAQRGLKGAGMRILMVEARELLLENPSLVFGGLNEAMGLQG